MALLPANTPGTRRRAFVVLAWLFFAALFLSYERTSHGEYLTKAVPFGSKPKGGTAPLPTHPKEHPKTTAEPAVAESPEPKPATIKPAVVEPSVAGPSVTEPSVTEPSVTEPSVTEPSVTEPSVTEPSVAEPIVIESTIAEPIAPPTAIAPPKYKPTPAWAPAPITDPFPLLANTAESPPPIPEYNVPPKDLHKRYGLSEAPPLFIGFTRQWGILLQAVVSYITAGWPPEGIYVVENTGVFESNAEGRLSLQNPFYLNHTTLARLGVNVIRTPVLLTFSQLQNFFLATAHEKNMPYYFYSHQDVMVFSFEDGPEDRHRPGDREWEFYTEEERERVMNPPGAGEGGYKTIYENCLVELEQTAKSGERWGFRWFQYDHLTLVNRAALDAVGGWDALMPYYGSDCDMNGRLAMDRWTMKHRRVGIINDVSTTLEDLAALYRDPKVVPRFVDPNPPPPPPPWKQHGGERKKKPPVESKKKLPVESKKKPPVEGKKKKPKQGKAINARRAPSDPREYFRELNDMGFNMSSYKYRDEDHMRNMWQRSQRGGQGEPYYYPAEGFAMAFQILVDAGREVFAQKWGHRGCDIAIETSLQLSDQWRVEMIGNRRERRAEQWLLRA